MKEIIDSHKTWHKFSKYIERTFGKDLYGEWEYMEIPGAKKKYKYRNFNELELSRRLTGYKVMTKLENWCKRYCPEIKFVRCDDSLYTGSDIILVPHPKHGITILFIPQCTSVQNQFFLYKSHYKELLKTLKEMDYVYVDAF